MIHVWMLLCLGLLALGSAAQAAVLTCTITVEDAALAEVTAYLAATEREAGTVQQRLQDQGASAFADLVRQAQQHQTTTRLREFLALPAAEQERLLHSDGR